MKKRENAIQDHRRRWQIRRLFLRPRKRYTLRQAGILISPGDVQWALTIHQIETDETGRFLAWEEVAFLARFLWGWNVIEDALGAQADVLPPLVRTEVFSVRLPKYLIAAIRDAAAGTPLGEFMEVYLEDLTFPMDEAPEIERKAPGYIVAVHYPQSPPDPEEDDERSTT